LHPSNVCLLAKLADGVLYMDHTALQEAGAQAVAGAMMATLPGIDANDPRKTLACFRFYSVVLSSVGTLQVSLQDLLWLLLASQCRMRSLCNGDISGVHHLAAMGLQQVMYWLTHHHRPKAIPDLGNCCCFSGVVLSTLRCFLQHKHSKPDEVQL